MTRIVFDEIKARVTVTLPCKICGKKRKRTISESSTINPFNTNDDGTVKTPAQVREQVDQKLKASVEKTLTEGITCSTRKTCEAAPQDAPPCNTCGTTSAPEGCVNPRCHSK